MPAFGSPWLFADRCALLRLPVPRHSPCALLRLTFLCSNHLRFSQAYPCSHGYTRDVLFFLFIQFSRCSLSRTVSLLSGFPKISPRQTSQITSERLPRLPSSFFLRAASRCLCRFNLLVGLILESLSACLAYVLLVLIPHTFVCWWA